MQFLSFNQQQDLAERYLYEEMHLIQMSKFALLKIASLKRCYTVKGIAPHIREDIKHYVEASLLRYVSPGEVLGLSRFENAFVPN